MTEPTGKDDNSIKITNQYPVPKYNNKNCAVEKHIIKALPIQGREGHFLEEVKSDLRSERSWGRPGAFRVHVWGFEDKKVFQD